MRGDATCNSCGATIVGGGCGCDWDGKVENKEPVMEFSPGVVITVGAQGMKFYSNSPIVVDAGGSVFVSPEIK